MNTGLSPLARGTQLAPPDRWAAVRFIPAGAGNTVFDKFTEIDLAVYPRWRGEHVARRHSDTYHGGLSPLARGTLVVRLVIDASARFIPAGAGNTAVNLPDSQ